MIKRDLQNIGDAYGDMLNALKHTIVKESKTAIKPGGNDFNDRGDNFAKQEGGLTKDGGASMALNDDHPSNCKCGCKEEDNEERMSPFAKKTAKKEEELEQALKNPKLSDAARKDIQDQLNSRLASESEEEKELQESRKMGKQILNTVMTRKTLSFDKLFRSVVNENYMGMGEDAEDDVPALGLDDEMTDDEMDSDMGGDEVTFTLDKATAQKLHDVLMAALGGEEEGGDEGDDLDFDMGADEDEDMGGDFEEDEETPAIGKLTGKPNTVGKVKPKGGKASSDVTDKVGDDGDYGHALYNAKQPNIGAGSNNKVGNYKAGGEYIK